MTRQTDFRAGLLDPSAPVPDGLLDGSAQPAGKRYDVYRNNVTMSLIEAMKTAFPLIAKLIGAENFDHIAGLYVRAHPPSSPLMMFYGTEFPAFVQSFEPLAHIGYLSDAAHFDLAMRRAYHAADASAFDVSRLQSLPTDALMEATFTLAPATQILKSSWPIHDIWIYNQSVDAPKPRGMAQDILITRPHFDPAPHVLPTGTADWLLALEQGQSFGQAHEHASTASPEFDLTESLSIALNTHAFADIHHKDLP